MTITGETEDLLKFSKWFEEKSEESFDIENHLRENDLEEVYTKMKSYTKIVYRFFSKHNFCSYTEWILFENEFKKKWDGLLSLDIINGYEIIVVSKQISPKIEIGRNRMNFFIPYQYQLF